MHDYIDESLLWYDSSTVVLKLSIVRGWDYIFSHWKCAPKDQWCIILQHLSYANIHICRNFLRGLFSNLCTKYGKIFKVIPKSGTNQKKLGTNALAYNILPYFICGFF